MMCSWIDIVWIVRRGGIAHNIAVQTRLACMIRSEHAGQWSKFRRWPLAATSLLSQIAFMILRG